MSQTQGGEELWGLGQEGGWDAQAAARFGGHIQSTGQQVDSCSSI